MPGTPAASAQPNNNGTTPMHTPCITTAALSMSGLIFFPPALYVHTLHVVGCWLVVVARLSLRSSGIALETVGETHLYTRRTHITHSPPSVKWRQCCRLFCFVLGIVVCFFSLCRACLGPAPSSSVGIYIDNCENSPPPSFVCLLMASSITDSPLSLSRLSFI